MTKKKRNTRKQLKRELERESKLRRFYEYNWNRRRSAHERAIAEKDQRIAELESQLAKLRIASNERYIKSGKFKIQPDDIPYWDNEEALYYPIEPGDMDGYAGKYNLEARELPPEVGDGLRCVVCSRSSKWQLSAYEDKSIMIEVCEGHYRQLAETTA
jgi:hypothetical protein